MLKTVFCSHFSSANQPRLSYCALADSFLDRLCQRNKKKEVVLKVKIMAEPVTPNTAYRLVGISGSGAQRVEILKQS
jgi:hypothetical protein